MRSVVAIPTNLNALLIWANNWKAKIALFGFGGVGLSVDPTAAFNALLTTYTVALAASGPANRTKQTTAALNDAKIALLNFIRPIVQQVGNFPEIAVALAPLADKCPREYKEALRINTHATSRAVAGIAVIPRTRIDEPTTSPAIDVQPSGNLQVKVRYHFDGAPLRGNSGHISSSAKPKFAQTVQFYYKLLSPVPGRNFYEGMVPMKTATRSPFLMDFDPQIGGRQVYVAARYVNPRGMVGPWSAMTTCTVPIEGVSISNVPA